jgi:hypothetical protein
MYFVPGTELVGKDKPGTILVDQLWSQSSTKTHSIGNTVREGSIQPVVTQRKE